MIHISRITELHEGTCDTNVLLTLQGYVLQLMLQNLDFPHDSSMSDSKMPGLLYLEYLERNCDPIPHHHL